MHSLTNWHAKSNIIRLETLTVLQNFLSYSTTVMRIRSVAG